MKKNTISVLLLLAGMFFGGKAFGQTAEQQVKMRKHIDYKKLEELKVEFATRFNERQQEAYKQAAIYGWPLEKREEGNIAILVDVAEGKPVYLTTHNIGSAITSRTNFLQPGGGLNLNLTGDGMIVGMWDGGSPLFDHQDLEFRAIQGDVPGDDEDHPTHVLGTMIGDGASDAAAKGMAPEAIAFVYTFANDFSEMAAQAEADPILLSNHSYGFDADALPSNQLGAYLQEAQEVDELTFAIKNYLPVFSAGNDGNGQYDRLTDRTLAKNALVVGAANQVNNYTGPSSVTLAGFSSWGPTNDNRIKPDIVTKGVAVYSCLNTNDHAHGSMDGTSMSAPGVTGSLLLVQQHYANVNDGNFMLSATMRGLVAHTADECGPVDAPGPDPKFGWGLLNVKAAAETITANGTTASIEELVLYPGETYTLNVKAAGGTTPLKATLAWTDPASPTTTTGTTKRLVNDLDIRVTKGSETNYPWKLPTAVGGAAIKGDNTVDNTEKVEIDSPSVDWYTVTISHKGSTLSNPGTGAEPSQEFSLIVTGFTEKTTDAIDFSKEIFSVWPNPASTEVNITLSQNIESNANAIIYDVQGRQVRCSSLTPGKTTIAIDGLSGGVYFVKVVNGEGIQTKKLTIK